MKSKFKGNGKNRILAVIASAVMFCLVVLLVIVTRKTDAVADTSVIINGKEYSQDNKMKILEIVSEDYYDELGPIIGNSSGSVKWDDIVAKATDKKVASNSDVQKNMDVYLQYVNGILLSGTNYNLCLEYKSGNSYNYYTTSNDAIQKAGTLDVDNIKLIFCKKDGDTSRQFPRLLIFIPAMIRLVYSHYRSFIITTEQPDTDTNNSTFYLACQCVSIFSWHSIAVSHVPL